MSDALSGEALEQGRRRRKWIIVGGLGLVGFVCGVMAGYREADALFDGGGWPPAMALGIAGAYLLAILGGSVALARQTDEYERAAQYKAAAAAACSYILTYPVWFLLWKGGFVPEPMHGALFIIFWVSLTAASIYYKFR